MTDETRRCKHCGKEMMQSTYWYCPDEQIQVPWGAPFPGTTAAAGSAIQTHIHFPVGDTNVTGTVASSDFRLQGSTTPPPVEPGE